MKNTSISLFIGVLISILLALGFLGIPSVSGPSTGGGASNPQQGNGSSNLVWNDPFNPPPSSWICAECPPIAVIPGLHAQGSKEPGLAGGPDPEFNKPEDPIILPPVVPPAGLPGGKCQYFVCWVTEHILTTPGGWKDVLVQKAYDGVGCSGVELSPMSHCNRYVTPCVDTNSDGTCTWGELAHEVGDDVEWEKFVNDSDGDGLSDAVDLFPEGENGPPNFTTGGIPSDHGLLKKILEDMGLDASGLDALYANGDPDLDLNNDGVATLPELAKTLLQAGNNSGSDVASLLSALNQAAKTLLADPKQSQAAADLQIAIDNLKKAKGDMEDLFILALDLIEIMPVDFFGGSAAKQKTIGELKKVLAQLTLMSFGPILDANVLIQQHEILSTILVKQQLDEMAQNPFFDFLFGASEGQFGNYNKLIGPDGAPLMAGPLYGKAPATPGHSTNTVGDPVNTWSGSFYYKTVDLLVPGRGLDFKVERVYDSRAGRTGFFGANWSSPILETRILFWGDWHAMSVFWGDGTATSYVYDDQEQAWIGGPGDFGKIRKLDTQIPQEASCPGIEGGYALRRPDGSTYYFCPPSYYMAAGDVRVGWLRKVVDLSGNALVIRRNELGIPHQIIDTLGRVNKIESDPKNFLITKITDPSGRAIRYSYDLGKNKTRHGTPGNSEETPESVGPGGWQAGGPTSGFTKGKHPKETQDEPVSKDLLRVDYPETNYLNESGVLTNGSPFESYGYTQSPEGFANNPEPFFNHNLIRVDRGAGEPVVDLTYGPKDGDPSAVDRVVLQTSAGKTTRYKYIESQDEGDNADPNNPYGQFIARIALVRFAEGQIERFFHGKDGELLRHEIAAGMDSDGDFLADNLDPAGPQAFVQIWEYNEDMLPLRKIETTQSGYLQGKQRETQWAYDSSNSDRFQQANVLKQVEFPDPTEENTIPFREFSHVYDPITARPTKTVDPLGRTATQIFGNQEFSFAQLQSNELVLGWKINLGNDPSIFGFGDVNGDRKLGTTFDVVKRIDAQVTVELPQGPGGGQPFTPEEIYRYHVCGQLVASRDAAGTWYRREYKNGYLAKEIYDAEGLHFVAESQFDTMGRLLLRKAVDLRETKFFYDGRDRLIESREVSLDSSKAIVTQLFYDLQGRPVGSANPFEGDAGQNLPGLGYEPSITTRSFYNGVDQVTRVVRRIETPKGVQSGTWMHFYDGRGQLSSTISPGENASQWITVEYEKDCRGLVNKVIRKTLGGTSFPSPKNDFGDYGELRKVTLLTDGNQDGKLDQTTGIYDGYQRLMGAILPDGSFSRQVLDAGNRSTKQQMFAANGKLISETNVVLDDLDRPVEIRRLHADFDADGNLIPLGNGEILKKIGYGKRSGEKLWSILDPQGEALIERMVYDSLGRPVDLYSGHDASLGHFVILDAAGRVLEERNRFDGLGNPGPVNPSESVTKYFYDGFGRRIKTLGPTGQISQVLSYHALGLPLEIQDADGNRLISSYDSAGRLWDAQQIGWDGLQRTVRRTHDIRGNLRSLTDGKGQTTSYEYDELDRLHLRRYADGTQAEYLYDSMDRLAIERRPGGIEIQYERDELGRTKTQKAIGGASGAADVLRQFAYDMTGALSRAEEIVTGNPLVRVDLRTASLGANVWEKISIPGINYYRQATLGLDAVGRATKLHYPSGFSVESSYDDWGRLQELHSATGGMLAHWTQPYGSQGYKRVDLADGARMEQDYDGTGLVLRKELKDAQGATLHGRKYQYTGSGNLEKRWLLHNGQLSREEHFWYDGFDRLTRWRYEGGGGVSSRDVTWHFDLADNRTSVEDSLLGNIMTTIDNPMNEIDAYGPNMPSFGYTACGEESTRVSGQEIWNWSWDALGRPLELRRIVNGQWETIRWVRDAFDRVISKTSTVEGQALYGYFGAAMLESFEAQAGLRVYANGLGGENFWRLRPALNEGLYLFHDPFHNVEAVHDGKALKERYDYTAFGEPWKPESPLAGFSPSATVANELFFLGKPYDAKTGLSSLGARLYDPRLGRFTSRDPLGEAGGLNAYSYGFQNPFRWKDPTGLAGQPQNQGASAGTGIHSDPWKVIQLSDGTFNAETLGALQDHMANQLSDLLGVKAGTPFAKLSPEDQYFVDSEMWMSIKGPIQDFMHGEQGDYLDITVSGFFATYGALMAKYAGSGTDLEADMNGIYAEYQAELAEEAGEWGIKDWLACAPVVGGVFSGANAVSDAITQGSFAPLATGAVEAGASLVGGKLIYAGGAKLAGLMWPIFLKMGGKAAVNRAATVAFEVLHAPGGKKVMSFFSDLGGLDDKYLYENLLKYEVTESPSGVASALKIFGHGSKSTGSFFSSLAGDEGRQLSVDELVEAVLNSGLWEPGTPIELGACYMGCFENGAAAQLAKQLGVSVWAPKGAINLSSGMLNIISPENKMFTTLAAGWQEFKP